MKVKITYWEGGNTWSEIIRANNVQDAMKQVKVNPVRYQMLTELAKGSRKNIENYLGDLIDSIYAKKK